ncbi:MAG: nucleotidyltransferase domain-containing protein [Deltaproteobacteria bacterium]|nr:nucleotidyltransferase domain-containing protein [Deltaproteobacteria bacterium]
MGSPASRRPKPPSQVSMLDALFPRSKQRVLALIFGQPDRAFATMELIRLAKVGSGAVQRELERLVSSGLVSTTQVEGQKRFRANRDAPLFEELRGIVDKTAGIAEHLRNAISTLAPAPYFAALYGSVAKATDTANSDLDVLIVVDDLPLERVYAALESTEARLARRVSPTLYSAEEFNRRRKARHPFLTKILAGRHLVLAGSEDSIPAR